MVQGRLQSSGKSTHSTSLSNPCRSNRTTSINAFTIGFSDNLDLEQHGDDILICGPSSDLECVADEFRKNVLVKQAEFVSLRPEHQKETHFFNRRICADDSGWHVEMDQRHVRNLLDAMAMDQ